jgi:hypothetical protein
MVKIAGIAHRAFQLCVELHERDRILAALLNCVIII